MVFVLLNFIWLGFYSAQSGKYDSIYADSEYSDGEYRHSDGKYLYISQLPKYLSFREHIQVVTEVPVSTVNSHYVSYIVDRDIFDDHEYSIEVGNFVDGQPSGVVERIDYTSDSQIKLIHIGASTRSEDEIKAYFRAADTEIKSVCKRFECFHLNFELKTKFCFPI